MLIENALEEKELFLFSRYAHYLGLKNQIRWMHVIELEKNIIDKVYDR